MRNIGNVRERRILRLSGKIFFPRGSLVRDGKYGKPSLRDPDPTQQRTCIKDKHMLASGSRGKFLLVSFPGETGKY
jgi:hypothetical protein